MRARGDKVYKLKVLDDYSKHHIKYVDRKSSYYIHYLLKEGVKQFTSLPSSATRMKCNRPNLKPSVIVPVLKDSTALKVFKPYEHNSPKFEDEIHVEEFLQKVYPNKRLVPSCSRALSYEQILGNHTWDSFVEKDTGTSLHFGFDVYNSLANIGAIPRIPSEKMIELRNSSGKVWRDYVGNHTIENFDVARLFRIFSEHIVVCPYISTQATSGGNRIEIYYVITENEIWYNIAKHF